MRNYSGGSGSSTPDLHGFYQKNTTHAGTRYYPGGVMFNDNATGPFAWMVANTLYATPVFSTRGVTVIGLHMVIAQIDAGKKLRLGLYDSVDDESDLYPNNLIVDGGEIDGGVLGLKSVVVSAELEPGKLYWTAFVSDGTPMMQYLELAHAWGILGGSAAGAAQAEYWTVARAYGALPATFPAGGAATIQRVPMMAITVA